MVKKTTSSNKSKMATYAKAIQTEAKKLKAKDKNLQHRDAVKAAAANLKKSGFFKK